MTQYKYGTNYASSNRMTGDIADNGTNVIVSSGVGFGDSPLAEHVIAQIKYGVANGQFNLLPPDPTANLGIGNQVPFWEVLDLSATPGAITAQLTTLDGGATYGVTIDPNGAVLDDQLVLQTRIPITTDTNLQLRQKLVTSLTKSSAYSSTNQWNLTATVSYYDHNNEVLTSLVVGTALHNQAWTQLGGTTTPGGSAISSSAAYCDIVYTLTATATVTDTTTVTINSVLMADSMPTTGSFVVAQTFTSSGTWTRPTGVDYVTVVAIGAGQGGQGAPYRVSTATAGNAGGAGGATGYYAILRDIYVGNVSTVSVGIGAGGAGGTAGAAISKPAGSASPTDFRRDGVTTGASGGDTTFGTYFTVAGARTAPTGFFGLESSAGASGGTAGAATGGAGGTGGTHTIGSTFTGAPYISLISTAVAGTAGTGSGGTGAGGAAGAAATGTAIAGGGGGGGGGTASNSGLVATAGAGASGGPGGSGGGGGAAARYFTTTSTITATAGNGANAVANSGGGGGGGGALNISGASGAWTASSITAQSSKGGDGGSGLLTVVFVA